MRASLLATALLTRAASFSAPTRVISGLRDLVDDYDVFLLDQFGVLCDLACVYHLGQDNGTLIDSNLCFNVSSHGVRW